NINFLNGDFDENINKLLDEVKNLAPTFFLIDPFGYSQIKLKTIKRIMEHKKSEILLNFMYNAIQRWVSYPRLEKHFNELFGCEHWRKYADERTNKKEQSLIDLFRFRCKEFSEFVYPFRLRFPDKNMPFYYLFHLCNHRKGCILMKDSFAKFNLGNLEYKGKAGGQLAFDLFIEEEKQDWEEYLFANFAGFTIPYGKLLDYIIDLVPSREREIKKVLQCFEKERKIKIEVGGRKRKCGIIESDLVIFKPR
ncbi:MAG: three-Cys-motif partner protein TcmP, partial [Candidatus Shapirobacteria bacterium]